MGELGALFNPGMRHELEERRSKAARREEEGNARDGDLRIDLESGVAVINIQGTDGDADHRPEDETGADHGKADQPPAQQHGRHAAAEPNVDRAEVASPPIIDRTGGTDEIVGTDQIAGDDRPAADDADQPPALRPRGKRGMSSAAHR